MQGVKHSAHCLHMDGYRWDRARLFFRGSSRTLPLLSRTPHNPSQTNCWPDYKTRSPPVGPSANSPKTADFPEKLAFAVCTMSEIYSLMAVRVTPRPQTPTLLFSDPELWQVSRINFRDMEVHPLLFNAGELEHYS